MKAMHPVACDLNILQEEKAAALELLTGLGYLLPKMAVKCESSVERHYRSIYR